MKVNDEDRTPLHVAPQTGSRIVVSQYRTDGTLAKIRLSLTEAIRLADGLVDVTESLERKAAE